jgi:5-hydroxyisourate hydrolase
MGRLTTHVLDTATGRPAAGVRLRLLRLAAAAELLLATETNADGRCDRPLLEGENFKAGEYQLEFEIAEYFRAQGVTLPEPPFVSTVILRFGIANPAGHYHVPLLVSPWSYSTYRGS